MTQRTDGESDAGSFPSSTGRSDRAKKSLGTGNVETNTQITAPGHCRVGQIEVKPPGGGRSRALNGLGEDFSMSPDGLPQVARGSRPAVRFTRPRRALGANFRGSSPGVSRGVPHRHVVQCPFGFGETPCTFRRRDICGMRMPCRASICRRRSGVTPSSWAAAGSWNRTCSRVARM